LSQAAVGPTTRRIQWQGQSKGCKSMGSFWPHLLRMQVRLKQEAWRWMRAFPSSVARSPTA